MIINLVIVFRIAEQILLDWTRANHRVLFTDEQQQLQQPVKLSHFFDLL